MATIPPNPDWFVYTGHVLSNHQAHQMLTGTNYGIEVPGRAYWNPLEFAAPVAFNNIYVFKSLNASVPGATSQASTGAEAYSHGHSVAICVRQDWGANSTNLSCIMTAAGGMTATVGYSSTSQQMGLSWLTDASGGTSGVSTTSNNGNWSSYLTGPKLFQIPVGGDLIAGRGTTLSGGEYFVAHLMSRTTGTTNSNVTLLSISTLGIAPQAITFGNLGGTVTLSTSQYLGFGLGISSGAASLAVGETLAGSLIVHPSYTYVIQGFSNV